jgi:hypothetical protein
VQPYRQIALLKALASGEKRSALVARFSKEWGLTPQAIYKALSRILIKRPVLPELWKPTKPEVIERMRVLDEAVKSGMSRAEIHERYRGTWGVSENWLDMLLQRVRARSQEDFDQAFDQARKQWRQQLQRKLAREKKAQDWEKVMKTLNEMAALVD